MTTPDPTAGRRLYERLEDELTALFNSGVSNPESWFQLAFTAAEARCWDGLGYTPFAALDWTAAFRADQASTAAWACVGMPDDPFQVLEALTCGLSPASWQSWRLARMNCFWWCRDSRRPPAGIRLDAPEVRSQCVGARAYAPPVLNTHPSESIEEIERRAVSWVEGLDKTEKTGSRHHTVPRFYLDRFADNGRLWVRDRAADLAPGTGSARHVRDMGVKDFYTSLTVDDVLDSRLEQVLSLVEAQGAAVLARLLNPFRLPGPLTADEEVHLSQFLSFQVVRGQRWRRDRAHGGLVRQDTCVKSPFAGEPEAVRFVPHPNDHLRMLGQAAQELQPWLLGRPCVVVILDRPLMLTCDEPVIFRCDNPVEHLPDCGMSEEEFRRRMKKKKKKGRKGTDRRTVHMYPARPRGAAFAYEIFATRAEQASRPGAAR